VDHEREVHTHGLDVHVDHELEVHVDQEPDVHMDQEPDISFRSRTMRSESCNNRFRTGFWNRSGTGLKDVLELQSDWSIW